MSATTRYIYDRSSVARSTTSNLPLPLPLLLLLLPQPPCTRLFTRNYFTRGSRLVHEIAVAAGLPPPPLLLLAVLPSLVGFQWQPLYACGQITHQWHLFLLVKRSSEQWTALTSYRPMLGPSTRRPFTSPALPPSPVTRDSPYWSRWRRPSRKSKNRRKKYGAR